jgi:uncharacterized phage-associated protein
MAYTALQVANEFLRIAKKHDSPITPMKLQKLVYFAHGWSLGIFDKPLIDEQIEFWAYGPVIDSVYHEFKRFGNREITELATRDYDFETGEFIEPEPIRNEEDMKLLNKIWDVYGGFTAIQLSNLTHDAGTPWTQMKERGPHPRGTDIPRDMITKYFADQIENE